jgi:hypothetical protein
MGARGLLVVAVVMFLAGTGCMAESRGHERDRQRLEDIKAVALDIQGLYGAADASGPLWDSLSVIPVNLAPAIARKDPATGMPYPYRKVGADRFELCATFEFALEKTEPRWPRWNHPAGPVCFQFVASRTMVFPVAPVGVRWR